MKLNLIKNSLLGALISLGLLFTNFSLVYAQYAGGEVGSGEVLGEQTSNGIPTFYFFIILFLILLLALLFYLYKKFQDR